MSLKLVGAYVPSAQSRRSQLVWLNDGPNVVYGLNGAGKSYLLEYLEACASGRAELDGGLVFRVVEDRIDEPIQASDAMFFPASWSDYRAFESEYLSETVLDIFVDDPMSRMDLPADRWWSPSGWDYRGLIGESSRELVQEVLATGYILLSPRGSEPRVWDVWPFVFPGSNTPALVAELNRFNRVVAMIQDSVKSSTEQVPDHGSGLNQTSSDIARRIADEQHMGASPLVCSRNVPDQPIKASFLPVDGSQPVFIRSLGTVQHRVCRWLGEGIVGRRFGSLEPWDLVARTREALRRPTSNAGTHQTDYPQWVEELADRLSREATSVVQSLLLDPMELELHVGDFESALTGAHPRWVVRTAASTAYLSLEDLSRAQRRWAEFAIQVAIETRGDGEAVSTIPYLWLIDEPESALHRAAEEHLAAGLSRLASEFGATMIAATHSPELLDSDTSTVLHARQGPSGYEVTSMGPLADQALDELGLRRSDLLRRQRVFLLVEGMHEVAILSALFADELARMRVQILPAHGARNFSGLFDSQFLFEFSDASVFMLIDNQEADRISAVWETARQMAQQGEVHQASAVVRDALPGSGENQFLRQFCTRALEEGLHERVVVYGLSAPDITDYLPIQGFASFSTWEEARSAFAKAQSKRPFKQWLTAEHGADFSFEHVQGVARTMDHIPFDFTRLLDALEAAARADQ